MRIESREYALPAWIYTLFWATAPIIFILYPGLAAVRWLSRVKEKHSRKEEEREIEKARERVGEEESMGEI